MATEPAVIIIPEHQQEWQQQPQELEMMEFTDDFEENEQSNNNDLITKKICCGLLTIMIGLIFTIIGFLWVIDPTPYNDCKFTAEYRCKDGGHDINPTRDTREGEGYPTGADGSDFNENALYIMISGLVVTAIGSFICYKGSRD